MASGATPTPTSKTAYTPYQHSPPRDDEEAEIRAAYSSFLRSIRRDVTRPFFVGAAAAFGMSFGACGPEPAISRLPTHGTSTVCAGYALWDACVAGCRSLASLLSARLK